MVLRKSSSRKARATKIYRLLRQAVVVLIFVLLGLFIIAYVGINTPKVHHKIERKVSQKLNQPFRFERFKIRGFDEIKLEGITLGKDQGIIPSVAVDLNVMKTLRDGEIKLDEITIEAPQLNLDLDSIESSLQSSPKKTKAAPIHQSPPSKSPKTKDRPKQPSSPQKKRPAIKPESLIVESVHYPKISIKGAHIRLHSKHLPENSSITLKGISLELASGINKSAGKLTCSSLSALGQEVDLNLDFPLLLKDNSLTFPSTDHHLSSIKFTTTGKLGLTRALPLAFNMQISSNGASHLKLAKDDMLSIKLKEIQGLLRLKGSLRNIKNVQVKLKLDATDLEPTHRNRGSHIFNTAHLDMTLKNGKISIPDYRGVSEHLSFLGNGLASAQGANVVCRIVTDDTWRKRMIALLRGSLLSHRYRNFQPLVTTDRYAQDFRLRVSPPGKPEYMVDPEDGWTELDSRLKFLQSFTVRELWTEEQ